MINVYVVCKSYVFLCLSDTDYQLQFEDDDVDNRLVNARWVCPLKPIHML